MKKKYFHASPKRMRLGTILCANGKVFLTESAIPHYTVFEQAYLDGWHVYEVEPLHNVQLGTMWDEWITRSAKIVRYVGNARGIIGLKRWQRFLKDPSHIPGSAAQYSWSKRSKF